MDSMPERRERPWVPCWTTRMYFLAAAINCLPSHQFWEQGFST